MAKIYFDITLPLQLGMITFPGDPPLEISHFSQISQGDQCNLSLLTFGSHTGTHIDAPKHFYDAGLTVDQLPLHHFMGPARVVEISHRDAITAEDLILFHIQKNSILLLKTKNSGLITQPEFCRTFAYLTQDAAEYLADIGIWTFGFDYLSLEPYGSNEFKVHEALLGKGIVIIEGLVLGEVPPGDYQLVALPIKIMGGNGSPVRAVLIKEE